MDCCTGPMDVCVCVCVLQSTKEEKVKVVRPQLKKGKSDGPRTEASRASVIVSPTAAVTRLTQIK